MAANWRAYSPGQGEKAACYLQVVEYEEVEQEMTVNIKKDHVGTPSP
jgi:hypothetical protein